MSPQMNKLEYDYWDKIILWDIPRNRQIKFLR